MVDPGIDNNATPLPPTISQDIPTPKSGHPLIPTILIVEIVLIILSGGAYYLNSKTRFIQKFLMKDQTVPTVIQTQTQAPTSLPTPTTGSVIADCGSASYSIPGTTFPIRDLDCFINATKTCTPAKVSITGALELVGVNTTSTAVYEIQGTQQEKCVLQITQGLISQTFPPSVPQDQQQLIGQTLQARIGKTGVCLFANNSDVTQIFVNWQNGTFSASTDPSQGDFSKGQCSGEYFSQN